MTNDLQATFGCSAAGRNTAFAQRRITHVLLVVLDIGQLNFVSRHCRAHRRFHCKLNRDKAYTYLKEAVDEIRTVGRYVFRRDRTRPRGYASAYLRRHRGAATVEDIDETAPDETTAAAAG